MKSLTEAVGDSAGPATLTAPDWKPPIDILAEAVPLKITDARVSELANDLATVGISGSQMRALRDLGILTQGIGVARMAGAGAAISHLNLISAIMKLANLMEKHKDDADMLCQLSHQLGSLSGKLSNAGSHLAKAIPNDPVPPKPQEGGFRSFTPGATINLQVNYPVVKPEKPV